MPQNTHSDYCAGNIRNADDPYFDEIILTCESSRWIHCLRSTPHSERNSMTWDFLFCKEMESKTLSTEVGVMNLAASENCTTTTESWSFLRLKWNCKILLNEETEPRCLLLSVFWPLNISKPNPNRNWLLQSLSGRRNEACRVRREWWQGRNGGDGSDGDAKHEYSWWSPKGCVPQDAVLWSPMNIPIVATILWSMTLLFTSSFEARVQHDSVLNLWVQKGKWSISLFWETLSSIQTLCQACGVHVCMPYPLCVQGQDHQAQDNLPETVGPLALCTL